MAVRYNYEQSLVDARSKVVVCTSLSCTIPADRKIGPIYYRMMYLNSSNQVLATSDIQTM